MRREQSHFALFISPQMFDLTQHEDKLKEVFTKDAFFKVTRLSHFTWSESVAVRHCIFHLKSDRGLFLHRAQAKVKTLWLDQIHALYLINIYNHFNSNAIL